MLVYEVQYGAVRNNARDDGEKRTHDNESTTEGQRYEGCQRRRTGSRRMADVIGDPRRYTRWPGRRQADGVTTMRWYRRPRTTVVVARATVNDRGTVPRRRSTAVPDLTWRMVRVWPRRLFPPFVNSSMAVRVGTTCNGSVRRYPLGDRAPRVMDHA